MGATEEPEEVVLSHIDGHGNARMVDVTAKPVTHRVAEARCVVRSSRQARALLLDAELLNAARISGIQAAKQVASLIPLCHSILIERVEILFDQSVEGPVVTAIAETTERTGVEMEALTACSAAALTLLHPMIEVDPECSIEELTLWRKTGGRSGSWKRSEDGQMQHR